MLNDDLVWKDEYGIGVAEIDNAHNEFFRIARRIHMASGNKRKPGQWAAIEGIKYLKAYVVKHFQEEEEYMRSIGYKDYELHKAQHEHLRTKIVPRVESYLHKHGESEEAIKKFVDILSLWITRHILIHDKAIGFHDSEG